MRREMFRKMIRWLGLLVIVHVVATLFFGIVLSSTVASMWEENPLRTVSVVLWFDIIIDALLLAYVARSDLSFTEGRRVMREEIKAGSFSIWRYFNLREYVIKMAIAAAFQLPFVVFFAIFGMTLQHPTLFEQFFIMDAGCYLLTDSAILGLLLNTLLFGAIYALVKIVFLAIGSRRIKAELE